MKRGLGLSLKGCLRLGILLFVVLGAWAFFRSYFLLLAFILFICSVAASFGMLWSQRGRLQAQAVLPESRVGRNTGFDCGIHIQNHAGFAAFTADVTYLRSNLFTGYSEEVKEHVWVAPAAGGHIRYRMDSRFAGRVEVRITAFAVYDLFHIFCLRGCERKDAHVFVWPTFCDAGERDVRSVVEGFPEENELNRTGINFDPDYEIREYIPGDDLKSIHWKLSAKKDELMVRERLSAGHDKINILLPLSDDRQDNDRLMDSLYALCSLFLHQDYPIQLYWQGSGDGLQSSYIAHQGELDGAVGEILSVSGIHHRGEAQARMAAEYPGEQYVLVQTGVYQGAYIR